MVPPSSASSSVRLLHTSRHLRLPVARTLLHKFRYTLGILSQQYSSHRSLSASQPSSQLPNRHTATPFARPSLCSEWHRRLILRGANKRLRMSCQTSAPSFTASSQRPRDARASSGSPVVGVPNQRVDSSADVMSTGLIMATPPPAYMKRRCRGGSACRQIQCLEPTHVSARKRRLFV